MLLTQKDYIIFIIKIKFMTLLNVKNKFNNITLIKVLVYKTKQKICCSCFFLHLKIYEKLILKNYREPLQCIFKLYIKF